MRCRRAALILTDALNRAPSTRSGQRATLPACRADGSSYLFPTICKALMRRIVVHFGARWLQRQLNTQRQLQWASDSNAMHSTETSFHDAH